MAYTTFVEVVATGAAGSNTIPITFPYIRKEDVKVYVDGTERAFGTLTWVSGGQVRLPDADASLAGKTILVRRETLISSAEATFAPGGLDHNDLNAVALQGLYADQEQRDQHDLLASDAAGKLAALAVRAGAAEGRLDAVETESRDHSAELGSHSVRLASHDGALAAAAADLALKQQALNTLGVLSAQHSAAVASLEGRVVSAGEAFAARDSARSWASAPYGEPVLDDPSKHSAEHYALDAAQSRTEAAAYAAILGEAIYDFGLLSDPAAGDEDWGDI